MSYDHDFWSCYIIFTAWFAVKKPHQKNLPGEFRGTSRSMIRRREMWCLQIESPKWYTGWMPRWGWGWGGVQMLGCPAAEVDGSFGANCLGFVNLFGVGSFLFSFFFGFSLGSGWSKIVSWCYKTPATLRKFWFDDYSFQKGVSTTNYGCRLTHHPLVEHDFAGKSKSSSVFFLWVSSRICWRHHASCTPRRIMGREIRCKRKSHALIFLELGCLFCSRKPLTYTAEVFFGSV